MKESIIALALLALIIGAGIYIRVDAAAEPMWLDECHTAWAVDTDDLSVVASRAADGNQPPLYFFLVWCVTKVFGLSEISLRFVSLVAGAGLLIAAPLFAKKLTDRWSAAVLVAGLLAFDGQFIYYAGEARSYALVQLLGLAQALLFCRMLRKPDGESKLPGDTEISTLVAWTMLSVLVLYCHYTSLWIIVAEALVIACIAVYEKRFPTKFVFGLGAVALSLTPRLWNVSMVLSRRSNWSSVSSRERLWNDVEPWLVHWILIPAAFAIAAWLYQLAKGPRDSKAKLAKPTPWRFDAWLILWAIIGPIGIAILDGLELAPMALLRYSAVCWVAMALFAGNCLKLYPKTASWIAASVILFSSLFGNWWANELYTLRQLPTFRNEDWVTTVSQIDAAESGLPIFQLADVIEDIDSLTNNDQTFQGYLRFPVEGAAAISRVERRENLFVIPTWNIQFIKQHLEAVRKSKGCWLIVRGEFEYAVHIPGELERHLEQPIEFKFEPNERMPSSDVHLIRVRLKPE